MAGGLVLGFLQQNEEMHENNNSCDLGMRAEGNWKGITKILSFFFFSLPQIINTGQFHQIIILISNIHVKIFLGKVK